MTTEQAEVTEQERVELTDAQIAELTSKNVAGITAMVPLALRQELEDAAEGAGVTVAAFVRQTLANAVGFTLPQESGTRAKKYASEDEKKAAQAKRNSERRSQVSELMRRIKDGTLQLN